MDAQSELKFEGSSYFHTLAQIHRVNCATTMPWGELSVFQPVEGR